MKYCYIPIYARNVWFSTFAEDKLKQLIEHKAANANVKKWLTSNLRNWLTNKAKLDKIPSYKHLKQTYGDSIPKWVIEKQNKEDIYLVQQRDISNISGISIEHLIDYLNTLTHNVSHMSVPEVVKQVRQWDDKLASKMNSSSHKEDGVSVVKEYSNGYKWIDIFGEDSLKREGDLMGHCVGGDRYYKIVKDGTTKIYSLRDPNNKPHVTIEYYLPTKKLFQIKGQKNSPPHKYKKFIEDFIKFKKIKKADQQDLVAIGYLLDNKGRLVPLEKESKDVVTLTSDLDIRECEDLYLPNIISDRDITFYNCDIYGNNIEAAEICLLHCFTAKLGILDGESIRITGGTVESIGEIHGRIVDLSCESRLMSTWFKIDCDGLLISGQNFYQIKDSHIKSLTARADSEIIFGDNITVEFLDMETDAKITRLGENNSLVTLDLYYNEDITVLPKGFKCNFITLDLIGLPKVEGKPQINDIHVKSSFDPDFHKEKRLSSSIEELGKFLKSIDYKNLFIDRDIFNQIKSIYPDLKMEIY